MNTLERFSLRGPVQTFRSEFAEWDLAQGQWLPSMHWTAVQFRPDGKVLERLEGNPNGSVGRVTNVYASDGRLLESGFQLDDGPVTRTVRRYDESGRLTQSIDVDGNGIEQMSEACSYDGAGRKTRVWFVPKLGNVSACGTFYGVEGAERGYGADGVATITTLYDKRGQPTEALFRNEHETVILRVLLTRDAEQRLVKEESLCGEQSPYVGMIESLPEEERDATAAAFAQLLGSSQTMSSTVNVYDDHGRRIERRTSFMGLSEQCTSWEYDEHDNPFREFEEGTSSDLQKDESGELRSVNSKSSKRELRFEYKYDSYNNWTERVVSFETGTSDFQRSNIERREFGYYP